MTTDRVAVVGAGPGGSIAAFVLARAGVDVDLIDPGPFPREKACGDLLGAAGVNTLRRLGLDQVVDAGLPIEGEHYLDRNDRTVRRTAAELMSPLAAVARPRSDLDNDLRSAAQQAGAALVQAKFVELGDVHAGTRAITLVSSNGGVFDRNYAFVIGADGARSSVAKAVGLRPGLTVNHAVSVRRYVHVSKRLLPKLWFFEPSSDLVSDAGPSYCWAFPVSDHRLNVGLYACAPSAGRNLTSRLETFQARLAAFLDEPEAFEQQSQLRGGLVRFDFIPDRVASQRVALIGDAVGLAHGILGEGISFAVRSGELAAGSLLEQSLGANCESAIVERFRSAFADFMMASRTEAHTGVSLFLAGCAKAVQHPTTQVSADDFDRSKRVHRIVTDAIERLRTAEDGECTSSPAGTGVFEQVYAGEGLMQIPAGSTAHFEIVGGGGAGGHWGGGRGHGALKLTGTIPAREDGYELRVVCAGAGGTDDTPSVEGPAYGGPGGTGHVPGGDGGWGSGAGAGGGGGGGGSSALHTPDRSIIVVAPGGGGGGGGGEFRSDGESMQDPIDQGIATPGRLGNERHSGAGGYGSTRGNLRGGGGGGGGGGSIGGDGGAGGTGGSVGLAGRSGPVEAHGVELSDVSEVDDCQKIDTPGRGGPGGGTHTTSDEATDTRLGKSGNDGFVRVEWSTFPEVQPSSNAGTATSTLG